MCVVLLVRGTVFECVSALNVRSILSNLDFLDGVALYKCIVDFLLGRGLLHLVNNTLLKSFPDVRILGRCYSDSPLVVLQVTHQPVLVFLADCLPLIRVMWAIERSAPPVYLLLELVLVHRIKVRVFI